MKAAADTYGWRPRASATRGGTGSILAGRGIAYAFRNQTITAVQIAEVEVNRRTGHVWVKQFVCAHDCGLVINYRRFEAHHQRGRAHSLGPRFIGSDRSGETPSSVRTTSPTFTHRDAPKRIDVVLVNGDPRPNRPDLPPYGAGKPFASRCWRRSATPSSTRPVPASGAVPDARVLAALNGLQHSRAVCFGVVAGFNVEGERSCGLGRSDAQVGADDGSVGWLIGPRRRLRPLSSVSELAGDAARER